MGNWIQFLPVGKQSGWFIETWLAGVKWDEKLMGLWVGLNWGKFFHEN
jgi:hypothetical protein